MSTIITLIQHSTGSPRHSDQTRRIKGILIGKGEVNLSLFAGDMTLYIRLPTGSTKKLFNLINEFGKVARYRVN